MDSKLGSSHVVRRSLSIALLAVGAAVAHGEDFVPHRLLVKFTPNATAAERAAALTAVGGKVDRELPKLGIKVISLPTRANEKTQADVLRKRKNVEFVEVDGISSAASTPNDPYFSIWQVNLKQTNCPAAWNYTTGSSSVIIAVLDSGINVAVPDLIGQTVPGWNAYSNNNDVTDVFGHGTAVAGVLGAASNNGSGVASVTWHCPIMPIRVSDTTGSATISCIATGLQWAADHGARIANVSFQLVASSTLDSALQYFRAKGGLVFSGSGNTGGATGLAENPYLITVGAVDSSDVKATYSSYGANVDISAPGSTYSTMRDGTYGSQSGTSFSTPMVAGAAALMWSINPSLSNVQVENILKSTSKDLGAAGWDSSFGAGRLDVGAAVAAASTAVAVDSTPPTVTFNSPTAGSILKGSVSLSTTASDDTQVDTVTFLLNGTSLGSVVAPPYSLTWNSASVPDGAYTLVAQARDLAGNIGSQTLSISVKNLVDTTAPTVAITSPVAGAKAGSTLTISATAADNVAVSKVEFYLDGKLLGTDTSAPYSFSASTKRWTTGAHTLTCKAYDVAANVGNSSSVGVTK